MMIATQKLDTKFLAKILGQEIVTKEFDTKFFTKTFGVDRAERFFDEVIILDKSAEIMAWID